MKRLLRDKSTLPRASAPTAVGLAVLTLGVGLVRLVVGRLVELERTAKLPAGPLVIVSNHRSVADGPLLLWACLRAGRLPQALAMAELFTVPVLGRILRVTGMIPVQRGNARASEALEDATALVSSGRALVLYPEGKTWDLPDEEVAPLKTGAARLALLTGARVAVLATSGTEQVVPYGKWLPTRLARAKVTTSLEVLDVPRDESARGFTDLDPAAVRALTQELHAALTRNVGIARAKRSGP